ncbi:hypothetical protein GCM10010315_07510 [Streptomyces luteosporeus]|uniref:Secreted protein n=1 Tax=Streptomyces luteosporeus TaxID=173856 RepID=A0ABN3TKJ1_9ACTN
MLAPEMRILVFFTVLGSPCTWSTPPGLLLPGVGARMIKSAGGVCQPDERRPWWVTELSTTGEYSTDSGGPGHDVGPAAQNGGHD